MRAWKTKLAEVKNLRQRSAELVYDRVKLLIEVYNDPEFLADEALDQLSAAKRLDDELADVCAGFLELKAVMEFYPERKQWQGRRLDLIVAEVLEAERQRHVTNRQPRTVKRFTKAEGEALQRDNEKLRALVTELRAENIDLQEQIGALKYQISELEHNLSREAVGA